MLVSRSSFHTEPFMRLTASRPSNCAVELLEPRQLFTTLPLTGTYQNSNGDVLSIHTTSSIQDRVKLQVMKDDPTTGVTQTIITTFYVEFEQQGSGAETIFQATLPSSAGGGTIMVSVSKDGNKTVNTNGTIDPQIFTPITMPTEPFVPLTSTGSSSIAQSVIASTSTQAASVSDNELLGGFYIGTFRRTSDQKVYKLKVSFSLNNKGHIAMEADFIIPGFGDVIYDTVVHPTHTGTFSVELGENALAGVFSAHLTHTGRLVSKLTVPVLSTETGSLKKHGS